MKKNTLISRLGLNLNSYNGSISPPVYHCSTILFPTLADYYSAQKGQNMHSGYKQRDCSYGSVGSLTAHTLGEALAALEVESGENKSSEGGCRTLIYPSGLLALTLTVITFASAGSHILVSDHAYKPLRHFIEKDVMRMGVEVTFYNPEESLAALVKENTSLIMMESPSSITCGITDIEEVVKIAKANGIVTVMDNTWATPIFFKPLTWGIDVSLYAATKYINGHSDVLMGVSHARGKVFEQLYNTYKNYGITSNSSDCYLVQRGLRTLLLRLKQHQSSAIKVARFLETVPEVVKVCYPALPSFEQHLLWKKYYSGATSLFSFILDKKYSNEQLGYMINGMKVFGIGASWGGFKSLILIFDLDQSKREVNNYHSSCVRIFCGLEDPEDLIEDLQGAFNRLRELC